MSFIGLALNVSRSSISKHDFLHSNLSFLLILRLLFIYKPDCSATDAVYSTFLRFKQCRF